jgi:large subunit ribosomal protein L35Ae
MGFRRGRTTQKENQVIVKIQGVMAKEDATYYLGNTVAYVYRVKAEKKTFDGHKTKYRTMTGKVIATHGSNGAVRCKFAKNLPPKAMGHALRVMLFPHREPASV